MTSELVWQTIDTAGWEHVRIMNDHPEWTVFDSVLVRQDGDDVKRGGYTLVVDKQWRTLELRVMIETAPGTMSALHLMTEGDGHWTDADGTPLPHLDGCIDVDIRWSPLTNTLPVNRLAIAPGGKAEITVAYIDLPELNASPQRQQLERVDGLTIRYTSQTRPQPVDIITDADGFVLEYPGVFSRTFPQ